MTRASARPVANSFMRPPRRRARWSARRRSSGQRRQRRRAAALRSAEEAEELVVGRQHERCVTPVQSRAIGLHRAVEGEEILVLAERVGVGRRRFRLALTAQDVGLALRLGEDDGPLALGGGADALRELVALGAELLRLALP